EKLHSAHVIAQILDDDFILAENFLYHDAHLPARHFHDNHVKVAVQRLERRQRELKIQADYFCHHTADACEQLSSHVLDFFRPQTPNFFHDGERQRKHGGATAHEERLRNNQRQRHFHREASAAAEFRSNFDFPVQRVHIGAHNIETHAAPRKLGLRSGGGKSRAKQEFTEFAFGQFRRSYGRHGTGLDHTLTHFFVINASPIIFHFNENVIAAMVSAHGNAAFFGFLRFGSRVRFFESVRDGVAHEMDQRV